MAKTDFEALWDRRDRLVGEQKSKGLLPERTLDVLRVDGGIAAVGVCAGKQNAFVLDWGVDSYRLTALENPCMMAEAFSQEPQGFGGLFGAGEKGAQGWMLRVFEGDRLAQEAPLLPGITAAADLLFGEDRFLNGRRRRADVPHWQLSPLERETCGQLLRLWQRLLPERTF